MRITKDKVNGMVELSGVNIKHKSFGVGKVIEQTDTYFKIEFPVGTKQFQFPEAFEKFLQCENSNIQNIVIEELAIKKEKEAEIKRQKQEEQARLIKTQTIVKPSGTRQKTYPKENIAFKCNYCNGGLAENGIGYICACSDEMIDYNIEVAQHNWCCEDDSPCKQYYDGIITRKELDSISEEDGFVCYESQMLRNWTAFAGFALTKENHQRPMKLNKVQVNSLAILTTREPHDSEKERFVFGFEESYGYLAGTYVRDKDAVVASMLICEMAAYYRKQGKTLANVIDEIYKEYGYYRNTTLSFEFDGASGMKKMKEIMDNLRENPLKTVNGETVKKIYDYLKSEEKDVATGEITTIDLPKSNVLHFCLGGNAVIIRPSGTEPKIKLYITSIGKTEEESVEIGNKIADDVKAQLGLN